MQYVISMWTILYSQPLHRTVTIYRGDGICLSATSRAVCTLFRTTVFYQSQFPSRLKHFVRKIHSHGFMGPAYSHAPHFRTLMKTLMKTLIKTGNLYSKSNSNSGTIYPLATIGMLAQGLRHPHSGKNPTRSAMLCGTPPKNVRPLCYKGIRDLKQALYIGIRTAHILSQALRLLHGTTTRRQRPCTCWTHCEIMCRPRCGSPNKG